MLAIKRNFIFFPALYFNCLFLCTFLSISLSGCSSDDPSAVIQIPWMVKYDTEAQISPKRKRYDLEEDGLPAQLPPSIRIHSLPDDPAQPWSINYGKETVINSSVVDENQNINIPNQKKINSARQ